MLGEGETLFDTVMLDDRLADLLAVGEDVLDRIGDLVTDPEGVGTTVPVGETREDMETEGVNDAVALRDELALREELTLGVELVVAVPHLELQLDTVLSSIVIAPFNAITLPLIDAIVVIVILVVATTTP